MYTPSAGTHGTVTHPVATSSVVPSSETYGYNARGELISAAGHTWGYDAEGNRHTSGYTNTVGNEQTSDGTWISLS